MEKYIFIICYFNITIDSLTFIKIETQEFKSVSKKFFNEELKIMKITKNFINLIKINISKKKKNIKIIYSAKFNKNKE